MSFVFRMNKGSFRRRNYVTSNLWFSEGLDTVKKKEGSVEEASQRKESVEEEPPGQGFLSRTLHGSLRRRGTRKGSYN